MSATVYLAPWGHDANPGTAGQPFASLARAQTALRARGTGGTAILRGGTYYLPLLGGPLVLGARDAGQSWQAAPGERPVLSGGLPVTGWTQVGTGMQYTAAQPGAAKSRALWVGDARYGRPFLPLTATGTDPTQNAFVYPSGSLYGRRNPWDMDLQNIHQWRSSLWPVLGVTSGDWARCTANAYARVNTAQNVSLIGSVLPQVVWNVYEQLTAGQAYLDRAQGRWYAWPRVTDDLPGGTTPVVAPILERLLLVDGAQDITVSGIDFSHTTWQVPGDPTAGWDDQVRGGCFSSADYSSTSLAQYYAPGAVRVTRSTAITFTGCRFRHLCGQAVHVFQQSQGVSFIGCVVNDADAGGFMFSTIDEAYASVQTGGGVVQQCVITNTGLTYLDTCGVMVWLGRGYDIGYNLIYQMPYDGIGWGIGGGQNVYAQSFPLQNAGNNHVHHNHIHHVMTPPPTVPLGLIDGGGIYNNSVQPGTEWDHNVIHDLPTGGNCLYMDNRSFGICCHDNLVYRCPSVLYLNGPLGDCLVYNTMSDRAPYTGPYAPTGAAVDWPAYATVVQPLFVTDQPDLYVPRFGAGPQAAYAALTAEL